MRRRDAIDAFVATFGSRAQGGRGRSANNGR